MVPTIESEFSLATHLRWKKGFAMAESAWKLYHDLCSYWIFWGKTKGIGEDIIVNKDYAIIPISYIKVKTFNLKNS